MEGSKVNAWRPTLQWWVEKAGSWHTFRGHEGAIKSIGSCHTCTPPYTVACFLFKSITCRILVRGFNQLWGRTNLWSRGGSRGKYAGCRLFFYWGNNGLLRGWVFNEQHNRPCSNTSAKSRVISATFKGCNSSLWKSKSSCFKLRLPTYLLFIICRMATYITRQTCCWAACSTLTTLTPLLSWPQISHCLL